tara:strand:- start:1007 stop:1261 length:255 start_codon:yes stop_codon:yes gene_type:complete
LSKAGFVHESGPPTSIVPFAEEVAKEVLISLIGMSRENAVKDVPALAERRDMPLRSCPSEMVYLAALSHPLTISPSTDKNGRFA